MSESRLNIRIDPTLKSDAEEVFDQIGMTLTTAINVFLRQSVREGGMPFQPTLNRDTAQALREVAKGNVETFESVEDWWANMHED